MSMILKQLLVAGPLMKLNAYDVLLLLVVSSMAVSIAYVYQPKWKAFLYALPLPFTFATLSIGSRINTTNVMGVVLLLGYTNLLRWLHYRFKVPVLLAILSSAVGYCVAGTILAQLLPKDDYSFWIISILALVLGVMLIIRSDHRNEPGYRTRLPIAIKLPAVMLVVLVLIGVKHTLQGFMTMFPMVGIFASYESRRSLWALCHRLSYLMIWFVPMMMTSRLLSPLIGLPASLLAGWAVYLMLMIPMTLSLHKTIDRNPVDKFRRVSIMNL